MNDAEKNFVEYCENKETSPCHACDYLDPKNDEGICLKCKFGTRPGRTEEIMFKLIQDDSKTTSAAPSAEHRPALQDSGARRQFTSGAVRDIAEGKGRCDLLPLGVLANFLDDGILADIAIFIERGNRLALWDAFATFYGKYYEDVETALLELSKHYEDGCQKYGERNWEKGIPVHCYIDSAVRHYLKFNRGDIDERHDRAFLWNIIGALWTLEHRPEMDDIGVRSFVATEAEEENHAEA